MALSNVERTFDQALIIKCMTNPVVWDGCTDDGAMNPDLYFPPMHPSVYWLRADDEGVFMAMPQNYITYECHTALLPSAKGRAVELGKMAIKWMFDNTPCVRIITNVPEFNRAALLAAKRAGFKQFGTNPDSYMKRGKLYSQILLGISKDGDYEYSK